MKTRFRLWAALAWLLAMFNFSLASASDASDRDELISAQDNSEVADSVDTPAPKGMTRHRHSDLF